jgi:hypothetical protein
MLRKMKVELLAVLAGVPYAVLLKVLTDRGVWISRQTAGAGSELA